ncbi:UTP--glucose-1-phosphate uridylyltransferase [Geodia barretti]|uniref:UTP--glucose-1-phosphate uridylyltransferase n=1 Tax=Geodia barretti TaxID=519541 RepID=A0AA35WN32_GEOBA|nr:UTP--glucose-1-phosphate uridylyltransferase [Geodia barretti]
MEVTNKTRLDVKGGTLINYEGNLHLLEFAQAAKDTWTRSSPSEIQVSHQQPVGESERPHTACTRLDERPEGGVSVNRKSLDGGCECAQLRHAAACCYQELQWSSRYQCSSESFPASEEDVGSAGGHVQPVPAERRDSGPEPSPALPRTTPRQTRRTLLHEGS